MKVKMNKIIDIIINIYNNLSQKSNNINKMMMKFFKRLQKIICKIYKKMMNLQKCKLLIILYSKLLYNIGKIIINNKQLDLQQQILIKIIMMKEIAIVSKKDKVKLLLKSLKEM